MSRPSPALARRYGRALVDVALEGGGDTAAALRSELRDVATLVGEHRGLQAALQDPRVAPESRRRILEAIAERAGLSPLARRLLALLARGDRLALLPVLARVYGEELNARRGVIPAAATGAVALSSEQERALAAALGRVSGRAVELESRVDPRVLGGLRVSMGGRSYDGTVRAHLAALRRSLARGR